MIAAAHLLAEAGPRCRRSTSTRPWAWGPRSTTTWPTRPPCGPSPPGKGRNLFLYEERPEAFVPGAVRTRLALLGARLPPEGARSAPRVRAAAHAVAGERAVSTARARPAGSGAASATLATTRRRWRDGAGLEPAAGVRSAPAADRPGRRRGGRKPLPASSPRRSCRGTARVVLAPRSVSAPARPPPRRGMGAVYHAERVWLFLPSGDGLSEVRHPLENGDARRRRRRLPGQGRRRPSAPGPAARGCSRRCAPAPEGKASRAPRALRAASTDGARPRSASSVRMPLLVGQARGRPGTPRGAPAARRGGGRPADPGPGSRRGRGRWPRIRACASGGSERAAWGRMRRAFTRAPSAEADELGGRVVREGRGRELALGQRQALPEAGGGLMKGHSPHLITGAPGRQVAGSALVRCPRAPP